MKIISITNLERSRGKYIKKMEIEVNGQRATVTFYNRSYDETYRERKRKSRLNVYGTAVESLAEDFVNRTRRPYKVYRQAAKPFLEALGLPTKGLVWNQYAYCSCPCSPAFVLPQPFIRPVGFEYSSWNKTTRVVNAIVDIDITIHEELPMVDESKDMDMRRVVAITDVLTMGELVTA